MVWNSRKVEVLNCIRELQIMIRIKVWVKMYSLRDKEINSI